MQTHPYLCEYECKRECQYQCERSLYISKYANANVIMRMRTLNRTTYGNTNIIICVQTYHAITNVITHPLSERKCKRIPYANANVITHPLFIQISLLLLRICECERTPCLSHIFVKKDDFFGK